MNYQTEIENLKKDLDAKILAHNYINLEVQKYADVIGDSLFLSRQAAQTDNPVLVFCGVKFMAETAAVLAEQKTVLIPEQTAYCTMAQMVKPRQVKDLKDKYPQAAVVCYVNSSLEVKAISDVVCTSANAVQIVSKLEQDQIIFVPDQNLGAFVQYRVPQKEIILPSGFCYVHHEISDEDLARLRGEYPQAEIIAHPECPLNTLKNADKVGSTSQMAKFVEQSDKSQFIICTEQGMLDKMKVDFPEKQFISPLIPRYCYGMKKITVESLFNSLKLLRYKIEVDPDLAIQARKAINRMFELS